MTRIIAILLMAFTLCAGLKAQSDSALLQSMKAPKKYTIGAIRIEGAENNDKSVMKLLSGLKEGDEISMPGDKITDAIKTLWKQGLFESIEIYKEKVIGNDVFLVIKVEERPRLTKYKFDGVRKTDADEIKGKMRLISGRPVTDYLLGSIKNTVHDHYVNKGFYFNKVDIIVEKDITKTKPPHVILTIKVTKGDKVRIKDVNIYGNTVLSDGKIRRKMKETKRRRWWNIFNSAKYLEENLDADLPNIIAKYNQKGYRDARIVKDTVYFVEPNRVNVDVTVDEGHKYYFGKFKWYGNTKYRSGQLDTILNIKPGTVYNQEKLDQKLFMNPSGFDISSLYMDDGYLFFNLQPQESNVHGDTIDYDVMIYEGKQALINKVTVVGNDKTNDHVIYRELRTRPGQLFRRSDIIRSQRQLMQLPFFNPEKMDVQPKPNPADGTVDIEYKVEEKPSDQIELSGGYGGRNNTFGGTGVGGVGIIGTLGVTFNNFSTRNFFKKSAWQPLPTGDGQRLSIRAQTNGKYYTSYNFSFTEPWVGGKKPHSLTFSTFHSKFSNGEPMFVNREQGVRNPNNASMKIFGASLNYYRQLKWPDNYFSMSNSLNYNYYDLFQYSSFVFRTGYAHDVNTNLVFQRNSVDQPIYPKTGSNFTFFGQLTPPYSLFNNKNYADLTLNQKFKFVEYQKYKFTAEWFTQLTNKKAAEGKEARNLVLRTKIGYGFLAYYNKNVGYSPFERFYVGGSGLSGFQNFVSREIIALRGYPDGSLSPLTGDPIVSRYTMELRYPITLNPQATIYVLGFAEAGNSYASLRAFDPFQVKRSAGVGLRVFLPMFGLLGIDYGWGFDNIGQAGAGNGKGQFHFTIGGMLGEL